MPSATDAPDLLIPLRRAAKLLLLLLPGMILLGACGCAGTPRERVPVVVALAGGPSGPGVLHAERWYQASGTDVLVLDPADGWERGRCATGPAGGAGPIAALVAVDGGLLAVARDEAVLRLDTTVPDRPVVAERRTAADLGVRPRALDVTRDGIFVSGPGGVRRWPDGAAVWTTPDDVAGVAASADGLVATVGRRAFATRDGAFVGSASRLVRLPTGSALPGSFAFVRHGATADAVGLMTEHLREVDARRATVTVPGRVHRVRPAGDHLWVAAAPGVRRYAATGAGGGLAPDCELVLEGAREVLPLDAARVAIAAAFGHGIWNPDAGADPWRPAHRAPGGVTAAAFDGRRLLVETASGRWLYAPDADRAQPVTDDRPLPTAAATEARTLWCSARVDLDGSAVVLTGTDGTQRWTPAGPSRVRCVAAVGGAIWIGHDDGITVLVAGAADRAEVRATLPLAGPVRFLFPLVGGGALFAGDAGVGTVRPRPIAD